MLLTNMTQSAKTLVSEWACQTNPNKKHGCSVGGQSSPFLSVAGDGGVPWPES